MAKIEIQSAFVEEQVGNPTFVLKCAEPHSKKDDQGNWQTVSRTFFDVKVSRDSGIDLTQFGKGSRIKVWGNQKTEVREHEGKKYYSLVVWAERIEVAQSQNGAGGPQTGWGTQSPAGGGNSPQNTDAASFGGGFGDQFADKNPF